MEGKCIHDKARAEVQKDHEQVSCGLFWAVGKYQPTNHMIVSTTAPTEHILLCGCSDFDRPRHSTHRLSDMQLCQRPLNGILSKPNYNNDYIAPKFRDYLMPARHVQPLASSEDLNVEFAALVSQALP